MAHLRSYALRLLTRLLHVAAIMTLVVLALCTVALVFSISQQPGEVGAQWKLGVAILTTGLVWLVLDRLMRLSTKVLSGDAFAPESAQYLRHISLVLVAFQLLPFLGRLLPPAAPDWLHSGQINGGNLLAIVVIAVLAEAFRQGGVLRDDVHHTV